MGENLLQNDSSPICQEVTKSESNTSSLAGNLVELVEQNYFSLPSIDCSLYSSSTNIHQQEQQQSKLSSSDIMTTSLYMNASFPSNFYSYSFHQHEFQDNSSISYYYPLTCSSYSNQNHYQSCLNINESLSANDTNRYSSYSTIQPSSFNHHHDQNWSQNELDYYLSNFDFENNRPPMRTANNIEIIENTVESNSNNENDDGNYKLPNVSTLFASTSLVKPFSMFNTSQFNTLLSTTNSTALLQPTSDEQQRVVKQKTRKMYTKKSKTEQDSKKKKKKNDDEAETMTTTINVDEDESEFKKKRGRPKNSNNKKNNNNCLSDNSNGHATNC